MTDDLRIQHTQPLIRPEELIGKIPASLQGLETVTRTRKAIQDILAGQDDRLIVIVGPCSIHDVDAALEYADKLRQIQAQYQDELLLVMRVYFEKPRTTVGWKGLINDPDLDGSFDINKGLRLARGLLAQLADRGTPAGVEFLDLITPQFIADLVSWGAIGARTTESQGHRELASGLSCPVGFKNGTGGSIRIAADAVNAAGYPHHFLSVTKQGHTAIFSTAGNKDSHVILRGGSQGPNFDADAIAAAARHLQEADLVPRIMVDCSHANSHKEHKRQLDVGESIAHQISRGNHTIIGTMIESHLMEGKQALGPGTQLRYGQSITDACLGWEQTQPLLTQLAQAVASRRQTATPDQADYNGQDISLQ